jgi:hypothetical protein
MLRARRESASPLTSILGALRSKPLIDHIYWIDLSALMQRARRESASPLTRIFLVASLQTAYRSRYLDRFISIDAAGVARAMASSCETVKTIRHENEEASLDPRWDYLDCSFV